MRLLIVFHFNRRHNCFVENRVNDNVFFFQLAVMCLGASSIITLEFCAHSHSFYEKNTGSAIKFSTIMSSRFPDTNEFSVSIIRNRFSTSCAYNLSHHEFNYEVEIPPCRGPKSPYFWTRAPIIVLQCYRRGNMSKN